MLVGFEQYWNLSYIVVLQHLWSTWWGQRQGIWTGTKLGLWWEQQAAPTGLSATSRILYLVLFSFPVG
jgi:hypothetical protein